MRGLLLVAALPWPAFAGNSVKSVPELSFKTGQVVAISAMADADALFFEGLTGSRYSHVGVIVEEDGEPVVYNSYPPSVQKVGLEDLLAKASLDAKGRPQFTLLEPAKPLTEDEQCRLVEKMEEMVGEKAPFNFSMKLNAKSVNCAEFVHRVFHHIGREKVGEVGALARMNVESFNGLLARKLGKLPPLLEFGVSPASVVHSPELRVVHAGLPVDRLLSDFEIYKAWKDGGGLENFSKNYGVSMPALKEAGLHASRRPYRRYPKGWRKPASPRI